MAKSKLKYPKEIYIKLEREREDEVPFIVAYSEPADAADISEDTEVAIYQLVRTAVVKTKVEVV